VGKWTKQPSGGNVISLGGFFLNMEIAERNYLAIKTDLCVPFAFSGYALKLGRSWNAMTGPIFGAISLVLGMIRVPKILYSAVKSIFIDVINFREIQNIASAMPCHDIPVQHDGLFSSISTVDAIPDGISSSVFLVKSGPVLVQNRKVVINDGSLPLCKFNDLHPMILQGAMA
jgi:hypothetical protein